MAAGTYNIEIEQGASFSRTITYQDSAGSAVDITGYTIRMQARETVNSSTAYIDINTTDGGVVITDAAAGEFKLTLTAAQTSAITVERGVYDLEVVDVSGNVTRLLQGSVVLDREITR